MNWIRKYQVEIIYSLVLLGVVFNRNVGQGFLLTRIASILALTIMSYFLGMRFKMVNTLILCLSILLISEGAYSVGGYELNYWSIAIALMLYLTLVMNIFLVIKEMYLLKSDKLASRNGFKLVYLLFAFLMLIGTVITSYSHIYMNIWRINPESFSSAFRNGFPAFYYSGTTYFTVGFGEITPVSQIARHVTLSQMFFSYMITCLIIPSVLVAFQKLFQSDDRLI